jgi:hypothetical protein
MTSKLIDDYRPGALDLWLEELPIPLEQHKSHLATDGEAQPFQPSAL